jgi:thioredoxin reductase/Pyruvate/2-oxoacid:ferredoxin oxidoreductase delta subunit
MLVLYIGLVVVIGLIFVWPAWRTFRREESEARALLAQAQRDGRHEPISIRPWVDPESCMASGICVKVCPEVTVLQVIDGTAQLVSGADCVGHGACEVSCPVNAVDLRFGSERRGVDLPAVAPDFQSNVPGLYIAGELGGMGLIVNAVKQGAQAAGNLCTGLDRRSGVLDLVIVGAGPAGIAASVEAKDRGLDHVVLEQDAFGGSILHFPRKKIVMAHGLELPGQPSLGAGTISKEDLIDLLGKVVDDHDLPICENERVDAIGRDGEDFLVTTSQREIRTRRVLLAVGRRGTPRKLGVPGEELEKVAYRLLDPELVHHQHVLIVGGGDSALEAAVAIAESPGNRITLSYRKDRFSRPKPKNVKLLMKAVEAGLVELALGSTVREIAPDRVVLDGQDGELVLANDRVYVFAGGVLPTAFLAKAGIRIERHFGDRIEVAHEGVMA